MLQSSISTGSPVQLPPFACLTSLILDLARCPGPQVFEHLPIVQSPQTQLIAGTLDKEFNQFKRLKRKINIFSQ